MTAGRWRGVRVPFGRVRRTGPSAVDDVLLLDLVAAALRTGVSIPRALTAVGAVCGSARLERTGRLLLLGADWEEAWGADREWDAGSVVPRAALARALQPAWCDGADPVPLLGRAAAGLQARRDRAAREAAGRLGVRLVLPLGLCHLPAFILIGVVPVLLSTGVALLGG